MDDLIKTAANGQWILEKAKTIGDLSPEERQRMIEDFQRQKMMPKQTKATSSSSMPTNMRPAQASSEGGMSKEKLAAIRAAIDQKAANSPNSTKMPVMPKPTASHGEKIAEKLSDEQAAADEVGRAKSGNKKAWEATVALLAQHGNKGYEAMHQAMQERKMFDVAHETGKMPEKPKRELQPPMVGEIDPQSGERRQVPRQGTFHGEGAVTSGKIVSVPYSYEDKESGEKRFGRSPKQEKHLWSWDHNNKQWNHVKTTHGSPNLDRGVKPNSVVTEMSRPKTSSPEALFPKPKKEE